MVDRSNNQDTPEAKSLDDLLSLVKHDLDKVNTTIVEHMHSPISLIPQLAGHIIAAGGKRLRPVLTLASAQLVGYQGDRHVKLAAVIELLHTATLLHDDVVDESELRRGRASANALFGNQPSVLVGDFLFSRSFELMVEDGSLTVLAILSRASTVIAEGEVLQLITANDTETTESAYLDVICSKTAALFDAACRIGAVVADRPKVEEDALAAYGLNLGIAFQLIDDALDYSSKEAVLGKTVGDDFREGKITLPVIHAFHAGDETEKTFWRRTLEKLEQQDGDLDHALALMTKHGSLDATVARARQYGDKARDALSIFPDRPVRRAMFDAIDFCVDRAY
jgi:octaprenyl-diphosphate synthase